MTSMRWCACYTTQRDINPLTKSVGRTHTHNSQSENWSNFHALALKRHWQEMEAKRSVGEGMQATSMLVATVCLHSPEYHM